MGDFILGVRQYIINSFFCQLLAYCCTFFFVINWDPPTLLYLQCLRIHVYILFFFWGSQWFWNNHCNVVTKLISSCVYWNSILKISSINVAPIISQKYKVIFDTWLKSDKYVMILFSLVRYGINFVTFSRIFCTYKTTTLVFWQIPAVFNYPNYHIWSITFYPIKKITSFFFTFFPTI